MKFEQMTNEYKGAQHAGYVFDTAVERGIDDDAMAELVRDRGQNWFDDHMDYFCDHEGDLYRGEDGCYYAVWFETLGGQRKAVAWQRLRHD